MDFGIYSNWFLNIKQFIPFDIGGTKNCPEKFRSKRNSQERVVTLPPNVAGGI